MHTFSIVLVLLVAAVGDVLGKCTGTTKTFAVGELKLTGKKGSCENTEVITGVTECAGSCESSSKVMFTTGKRPKYEGKCQCCKLQAEEVEVKLKCTPTDGAEKNITKKMKFPKSCGCEDCKRKGKGGKKGGKKPGRGRN